MTNDSNPGTNEFENSGNNDPLDLIRATRPAAPVDPELIARAGADFRRRINADTSRPILRAVEPGTINPSDAETPTALTRDRSTRFGSRYAYLGLVAAVVLAALFVPPLLNRRSGPPADESATIDDSGLAQEIEAAHPHSEHKRRDRRDNGKHRDNQTKRTKPPAVDGTTEPDQPATLDEPSERAVTTTSLVKTVPGESDPTTSEPNDVTATTFGSTTSLPTPSTTSSTTTADPGDSDVDADETNTSSSSSGFVANFDNNEGLDQFRVGVFHRNIGSQELGSEAKIWGDSNAFHGGQWTEDHDLDCGMPTTQRTIESRKLEGKPVRVDFAVDEVVYLCRDHLMSSMGDVDGYSIVWFSPKKQFVRSESKTVSWEVNVTDLKSRQWWEVSIVPTGTAFLSTVGGLAGTANIDTYHQDAVIVGNGPFGGEIRMTVDGKNQYGGSKAICGKFALDPEACADKKIRRTFSVTDNNDGTLTIDYGGMFTQTMAGQLPESFQVFFKDHNYTPDKDGVPIGHTWHWDSISVR